MRMWLLIALAGSTLCGCGLDDAVNRMNMAQFRQKCAGFGFQPGTDAFAKCMMQQSTERDQFNQHIVDQENKQDAAAKQQSK